MSDPERFTFFWSGPFSQWHRCRFVLSGSEYSSTEQYMMEQKALLFGDLEAAALIRRTSNPRQQKALGRKVQGFDAERWSAASRDAVFRGNWAKFTQDPKLKAVLLATEGTTLVEASPSDRIWGIGLAEDDPRVLQRDSWQGTNWLGQVLTAVRLEIVRHDTEGLSTSKPPQPPAWQELTW